MARIRLSFSPDTEGGMEQEKTDVFLAKNYLFTGAVLGSCGCNVLTIYVVRKALLRIMPHWRAKLTDDAVTDQSRQVNILIWDIFFLFSLIKLILMLHFHCFKMIQSNTSFHLISVIIIFLAVYFEEIQTIRALLPLL